MKERFIQYADRGIQACLCFMMICLPFTKAGLESFVWFAMFLWILKHFFGYRKDGRGALVTTTPLNRALLVFLAANIIATVLSVHFGLSAKALFGKLLKFLAIFFIVLETVNTGKRLRLLLMGMLVTAAVIGADAMVQCVTGVDLIRGIESARLTASFFNPNDFAGWLTIVIPLFSGVLLLQKSEIFTWKISSVFVAVLMLLWACLLLTYSRGAWLGLMAGFVLWAGYGFNCMSLRMKTATFFTVVILFTAFFVFSQGIWAAIDNTGRFQARFGETLDARIRSIPDGASLSTIARVKLWKEAFCIWKTSPLTGTGLNTYARVSPKDKQFAESGWYPHNCYLQMAAETGLIGLLAFLWVVFEFFRAGIMHIRKYQDFLVVGLLCGIFAFLVHCLVDSNLYQLQLAVLFWFMLGLTMAVMRIEAAEYR